MMLLLMIVVENGASREMLRSLVAQPCESMSSPLV